MIFCFLPLVHTTELSPRSSGAHDHVTSVVQIQTDEAPTPLVNFLSQLYARKQRLHYLQTASTITDYTCQFTQIALTIPQLTSNPSENTGIWLNSFNLAAGIIALSQIPIKKWLQSRAAETEDEIARLQIPTSSPL